MVSEAGRIIGTPLSGGPSNPLTTTSVGVLSPSFVAKVDHFISGEVDLAALYEEYVKSAPVDQSFFFPALQGKLLEMHHHISFPPQKREIKDFLKERLHKAVMRMIVLSSAAPEFVRRRLDSCRLDFARQLLTKNFTVLRVALQDPQGVTYDGILAGRAMNIAAGRFVVRFGGSLEAYEATFAAEALLHDEALFATIQINGPGTGRSQGVPTVRGLQEAARMSLLFAEALSRQYRSFRHGCRGKIMLKGFDLGGGALAQAITQHLFKTEENDYEVMFINTFGRLSNLPGHYISQFVGNALLKRAVKIICSLAGPLFRALGIELDVVAASERLTELNIPQVIVQACHKVDGKILPLDDGIIGGEASLVAELQRRDLLKGKTVVQNTHVTSKLARSQGTYKTRLIHRDVDNHMLRWFLEDFRSPFAIIGNEN